MNKQKRLISLVIWGIAIACILALVFQNLQPLVTIYFLNQFTIPIPLSLGILAAFLIGSLSAFMINLVGFWLSPKEEFDEEIETEEEFEETPASGSSPQKPNSSNYQSAYKPNYESNPTDTKYDSSYDDDEDEDDDDVIDVKYIR